MEENTLPFWKNISMILFKIDPYTNLYKYKFSKKLYFIPFLFNSIKILGTIVFIEYVAAAFFSSKIQCFQSFFLMRKDLLQRNILKWVNRW